MYNYKCVGQLHTIWFCIKWEREKDKRDLGREYTIESNCIKRERDKSYRIWICIKREKEKFLEIVKIIGQLSHIANKKFIFVCYSKVCIIAFHSKHRNCIIRYTYTVEANCIKRSV